MSVQEPVNWSTANLPRYPLTDTYTPLDHLRNLGEFLDCPELFVKRDDAMPLGLGGNKLRSLEFWIGEAMTQGCDTLVVAGHPVSNQCRLTAAAAAKAGLRCVILHSDNPPPRIDGNLMLNYMFGAEISFLGPVDETRRAQLAQQKAEELRSDGAKPYVIGNPVLGAMGYVRGAQELLQQASENNLAFDHLILPGSMGPTEAGFLYGLLDGGFAGQVHIISVEYGRLELANRIELIFNSVCDLLGKPDRAIEEIAVFDDRFLGEGYGKKTPQSEAAMELFARKEALLLDPIYTAKPFAASLALIEDGSIPRNSPICLLHTGGVPSLFGDR